MRIKYLVPVFFALGLIAPEAKADHHGQLAYVLPVEVTVIGLTGGIRPEIVYTPFKSLKWFETKASVGLMPGAGISQRRFRSASEVAILTSYCTPLRAWH